jgi:hypothetical protein
MRQKNGKISQIFKMNLHKEKTQMANKHVKMFLRSLIFMATQIKTTRRSIMKASVT